MERKRTLFSENFLEIEEENMRSGRKKMPPESLKFIFSYSAEEKKPKKFQHSIFFNNKKLLEKIPIQIWDHEQKILL